jgi:hypothetical protein
MAAARRCCTTIDAEETHLQHIREILAAYSADRISREQLIAQLVEFPYVTPSRFRHPAKNELGNSVLYDDSDTWVEVSHAYDEGVLDETAYREVINQMEALGR